MPDFDRVAVIGHGAFGAEVAAVLASTGATVSLIQVDADDLPKAASGTAPAAAASDTNNVPVAATGAWADVATCQLIIEAVADDATTKHRVLADLRPLVAVDAVVVTTTATLSVTQLAATAPDPTRVAGLHFFNDAHAQVVEVIPGVQTNEDVLNQLTGFLEAAGKVPVRTKDRPGFLINHLQMPYLNDVISAYDEELASATDIDVAIKLGLGYKVGPLEMLDSIGLDTHLRATVAAYEATHDPQFAPPALLRALVDAGALGAATGTGFHNQGENA